MTGGMRAGHAGGSQGQVLPLMALFMLVLIGFAALTIDYGTYLLARRTYQNNADAAALAGSVYMTRPIDSAKRSNAVAAAWDTLQRQLNLSGSMPPEAQLRTGVSRDGWTLQIATPASAATSYPGSPGVSGDLSVYARVERDNPSYLSRLFGIGGRRIAAWATAGNLPSRWAILALCPRNGSCPSTSESITISGTYTYVRVIEGDVGDNWGLKINSNFSQLQLPGDSQAYFVDTTCGPSRYICYPNPANVNDGSGGAKETRILPAPVADPAYPEPSWLTNTTAVPTRQDVTIPNGTGTVQNSTGTTVGCSPGSPRIGPGRYANITVRANSCVILDPTRNLQAGQRPGVYYITGDFDIGNASFVIGDGVSIFFDSGASDFNPSGGIVVNTGNANIPGLSATTAKKGAWTSKGLATWSVADGTTTPTFDGSTAGVGMAFYVRQGTGTTSIFNMSGTTPLMFSGILYGPRDNLGIAGSGAQAAVGQIVGWTITYAGNTTITQTFEGPDEARSYLLEPRTGQGD